MFSILRWSLNISTNKIERSKIFFTENRNSFVSLLDVQFSMTYILQYIYMSVSITTIMIHVREKIHISDEVVR